MPVSGTSTNSSRGQDVQRDRVNLVYKPKNDPEAGEVELPFRVLVLADLGGNRERLPELSQRSPIELTRSNYDRILASVGVRLVLRVPDYLRAQPDDRVDLVLEFRSLADFGPDAIAKQSADLRLVADLRSTVEAVRDGRGTLDGLNAAQRALAERMGYANLESLEPAFLNLILAETVDRLSRQMDAIVQHPDFQRLESTWRSLRLLVDETVPNTQVHVLDTSKQELADDFEDSPDLQASALYDVAYTREYGSFGGHPFGVMIGDYRFGSDERELRLLRGLGGVASMCHTPLIAGVSPSLFGLKDFAALPGFTGLADLLEQGIQHARWRGFRDNPDSRYVGLTLPGFLLRAPWDYRKHGITRFPYREQMGGDIKRSLFGNSAFAFAQSLMRSFARSGWCLDIIGEQAGKVDVTGVGDTDLPAGSMPTDILLSERREAELSGAGFIPLTVHGRDKNASFFSAQCVHRASANTDNNRIDLKVGVQFPYLFVISRLAHYLKVIQRDNVGMVKNRAELERELSRWLQKYVSDMDNPAQAVRAKRPLRRAEVSVTESDRDAGWYQMSLNVTPHFRYLGAAFQLQLDGRLEKGGETVENLGEAAV